MREQCLFILILVTVFWIGFGEGFRLEEIEKTAKQCCAASKTQCCVDMMKFGRPVRCGYEKSAEWVEILYNCVQRGLLSSDQQMPLYDGYCCQVFAKDSTDSSNQCERTCKLTMQSPSLDKTERFEKIRKCSTVENPLNQCFHNCLKLRKDGISTQVLEFSEYCNYTAPTKSTQLHFN